MVPMMDTTLSTAERRTSLKWEWLTDGKDGGESDHDYSEDKDIESVSFNQVLQILTSEDPVLCFVFF